MDIPSTNKKYSFLKHQRKHFIVDTVNKLNKILSIVFTVKYQYGQILKLIVNSNFSVTAVFLKTVAIETHIWFPLLWPILIPGDHEFDKLDTTLY
jgi:hypothetical protein